jgi:hypothetical protein
MIAFVAAESRVKVARDTSAGGSNLLAMKPGFSKRTASRLETGYPRTWSGNKCRKFFSAFGLRVGRQFYPQSAREYYDYCYL